MEIIILEILWMEGYKEVVFMYMLIAIVMKDSFVMVFLMDKVFLYFLMMLGWKEYFKMDKLGLG